MNSGSAIYEYQPSFILGFHGCEKEVGEYLLSGKITHLRKSEKEYDWLGSGVYFWESNLARAKDWANNKPGQPIKEPFVIGAVIDLKHCLDLFDSNAIAEVKNSYEFLKAANDQLPKNKGQNLDKVLRNLDCLVINNLHHLREMVRLPAYDSVRGPFLEGEPIYEGAGFRSKTHIQICVRNTDCIKGYFRPIE